MKQTNKLQEDLVELSSYSPTNWKKEATFSLMITIQMDGSQVFEKDSLGLKYLNFKKMEKEYMDYMFSKANALKYGQEGPRIWKKPV